MTACAVELKFFPEINRGFFSYNDFTTPWRLSRVGQTDLAKALHFSSEKYEAGFSI
jgi:hypothetical protein